MAKKKWQKPKFQHLTAAEAKAKLEAFEKKQAPLTPEKTDKNKSDN